MKKYFAESELIINQDRSIFHLHLKPEQLADRVILVGDPGRVALVASHFDKKECEVSNREFTTITGVYRGKRITVLSTGIGCDNIDIVVNELDALANIDFRTREECKLLRQLTLVRIGTCGGLQPDTPVGTFIASEKSIGFDGLLNFYAGRNDVCDLAFEEAFTRHMNWNQQLCARKLIVAVHRPRLRRRHILLLFALGRGRRHSRCINPGTRDNRGTHSLTARSHSITCCFRLLSDARPCRSNGRTGTRRSSVNTGGGCGLLLRFLRGLLAPPLRLGGCISDGRHFVSIGQRRLTSFQHRRRFFNGVVIHW